ncbi:MAG: MCE family protein [Phycisphaerae bacterium]|nr:MCE family protein [Phycisphaerae bacterium]
MEESVKGLTEGSMVYYQGIQVGEVDAIATAPVMYDVKPGTNYGKYIVLRIALTHERITSRDDPGQYFKEMVKQGLCFQMKSSPLTGVGFLEASIHEDKINPEEWIAWTPKYPYIPSVPSLMSALADSAETVFKKLSSLDVQSLIDNANILLVDMDKSVKDIQISTLRKNMEKLLTDADATMMQFKSLIRSTDTAKPKTTVEDIMAKLNSSVNTLQQAIMDADVKGISNDSKSLLTELRQSNQQVKSLLRSTDQPKALSNIEVILADLDDTIRQINLMIKQQYPNLDMAIQNLVETSKNLKEGTAEIKSQPSQLLFSHPPAKSEIVK